MAKRQTPLATPGEILLEEFLKPLGVTQYRLAKEIGGPQRRIGEIVAGKRSISADTAARLGVYFGMEAEFWLNLQAHYDLALMREALAENGGPAGNRGRHPAISYIRGSWPFSMKCSAP